MHGNTITPSFSNFYQAKTNSPSLLQNDQFASQQFSSQGNSFGFFKQDVFSFLIASLLNQLLQQLTSQLSNNGASNQSSSGSNNDAATTGSSSSTQGDSTPKQPISTTPEMFTRIPFGLSSAQSIPANNANGTGSGDISVNENTGELKGSVTFSGLTGKASMVHIHGGETGKTGPVILTLEQDQYDPNTYNIPQGSKFEGQNLKDFIAGDTYINLHTEQNPKGEVRGQIVATVAVPKQPPIIQNDLTRVAFDISSAQSIPANNANGAGSGNISIDKNTGKLDGSISFSGLTGDATMVHIHSGKIGETGPITLTLEQDPYDPNLYNIPQGSQFEGQNLKDFLAGDTYINVHTDQNPKGEVRGQIVSENMCFIRS